MMHSTETPEPTPLNPVGTPSVTRLGVDETKRTFPPRRRLGDDQEREVTRLYVETTLPVAQIGQQFGIGESSVYRIAQRNGASLRGRTPAATPPVATPVEDEAAPVVSLAPVDAPVAPEASEEAEVVATPVAPAVKATRPRAKRAPRVPRVVPTPTPSPSSFEAPAPVVSPAPVPVVSPAPVPVAAPRTIIRRRRRTAAATPVAAAPVAASTPVAPAPVASGAKLRFRIRFFAETVIGAADIHAALRQVDTLGATEVSSITRED